MHFITYALPSRLDVFAERISYHEVTVPTYPLFQYAPYDLAEGTWDDQREAFGDAVIDTIAERAPNIRSLIVGRQVLTPLDIERTMGMTEGNIFQGELSLEQLFFLRPVPGWAQYHTPIPRLYMCGSATHPGGGIMGAPGKNAAEKILKDGRR